METTAKDWAKRMPVYKSRLIASTFFCESCGNKPTNIFIFDGEILMFCASCANDYREESLKLTDPDWESKIHCVQSMGNALKKAVDTILEKPRELDEIG